MEYQINIKDVEVLETNGYFTWVHFIYDIEDNDGKVLLSNLKSPLQYGTISWEGNFDEYYNEETDEFEISEEEMEEMNKEDFYRCYMEEIEDGIDILTKSVCRSSCGIGYEECDEDQLFNDLFEIADSILADFNEAA